MSRAKRTSALLLPTLAQRAEYRDCAQRAQGRRGAGRHRAPVRRDNGRCSNAAIIRPTLRNCANCCSPSAMPRSSRRRPRIRRISRSSASRIRASPAPAGAEITVAAQDGRHAVIIGKPIGDGNFARRGGENRSYIVEPAITFETEPRYWIESRLIDVPTASIQSIEVKPASRSGICHSPSEAQRGRLWPRWHAAGTQSPGRAVRWRPRRPS